MSITLEWDRVVLDRLEAGTLARGIWRGRTDDGRETACLLAAIVPECGDEESADVCPASLMSRQMAELTPWIDDSGTDEAWPDTIKRYVDCLRRSSVLTPEDWRRLDLRVLHAIVSEARQHATNPDEIAPVDRVIALLDRSIAGEQVGDDEWQAARAAARRRAGALVVAAGAAAGGGGGGGGGRGGGGAEAAAAAWAARAARAAAAEANERAGVAAAQRIIDAILAVWADEIARRAEGGGA